MASTPPREVTRLLHDWSEGDREALDALIPLVHAELHRLARGYLARERIFLSDFFHARMDARARRNLRRAVTRKQ